MKLALVHDWLTGMRGGEKCLEVLCRLFPDAELFTLLHARGRTSPAIERMRIRTSFLQRVPGVTRHYRYWLPLMPRAVERLQLPADVDLVVSLSHAVAKSVRPPRGVPHVCYCFTPMRYAWHLRGEYFPKAARGKGQGVRGKGQDTSEEPCGVFSGKLLRAPLDLARDAVLERIRCWDRETSGRVGHFVAISRTVARRIEECYGRESTVIYPPVDTEFYTPADLPREDSYLCVSALAPYKRVELAIEACSRLGRQLIVIGDGPERRRLERLAGPTVRLLGWQPDEAVRDHLRRCRALLFPGLEDFGIVPLEAQACATPVIAYGAGGVTETVSPCQAHRRGTGVFFGEQTAGALAQAIEWFESHTRLFDSTLARRQAERFGLARFEGEMLHYLQQVYLQQIAATRGEAALTSDH